MGKEIKFSLVYRDMWQSSGKYQPRVDQLTQIAPVIIDMGCFARVETNGGAFEQVNLLYGENPNKSVRAWTAPFNKVGIQTHMLERGLNALRMYPVPKDVRQLMFKVKCAQGTNISRSFDGLNDPRNLELSVKYAKEAGMISQTALCITHSPIHTVEYYVNFADKLIDFGADEICLKDMAGVGRPAFLGRLVKALKDRHPNIPIEYHGHTGPGFSVASMLEVARAGADYLDTAIEPLAWGMVHPDVITIQAMLKDAGFLVPDINMSAYMEARALTQSFIDDFLGYWIDPSNKFLNSLLVGCGLPGGMMGSMMADLRNMHPAINMALRNNGKAEVSLNDLVVQLFEEVEYIWPKLGYPPLVTPFSQYVKNIALMNIFAMAQGQARFSNIDKDSWNMILGKTGTLPGKLDDEIIELAKAKGLEFYTGNPQDEYPDALDEYRKEMDANGWEYGEDDEELFELAMHDRQYRDYKSGLAKQRFNEDLEKMKEKAGAPIVVTRQVIEVPAFDAEAIAAKYPDAKPLQATVSGQVIWQIDVDDVSTAPVIGTEVKEGQTVCFIQTYYGIEEVKALASGKIVQIETKQGAKVQKNQVLAYIN
ncbi:pyruvate carboxylase subunit B [Dysgonomonas sp. PFB1-18]|uniref:biotin/lipoyl-containing protein n=1 Tax=unclassified Dysgonomonas TaxID=2630389 RepID=UPI002475F02E|nr:MULTISPECIES: biotin/lipoyl-containing protein [unclassified Dysgonomonas]MDH6308965.1 pyruvate carboxylase subunit B [Dysgonomonas sp. PF1-14]MDH6338716.1 pyruvate carboxylase subunit B [Dysgonomonas sp. PF1-16]MDH6380256.1 pyruvate carboxylase subunit B [Dysgonomonas sp. PFB1-18]MDH6397586.1 pyruvate carboxylase subunit B [Dysgonomonas sp. PF1-23]